MFLTACPWHARQEAEEKVQAIAHQLQGAPDEGAGSGPESSSSCAALIEAASSSAGPKSASAGSAPRRRFRSSTAAWAACCRPAALALKSCTVRQDSVEHPVIAQHYIGGLAITLQGGVCVC